MEELRQIALAYYSAVPKGMKDMVEQFYKEMDPKDNGYVKFKEFSAYIETIGRQDLSSEEFFDLLKHPRNEVLYIEDVITLFYIIYSKKHFCGGKCRKFVTGMSFTCWKCFDKSGSTFNVCPQCFEGEQYKHEHERTEFHDPMIILHHKRELAINQKSSTSRDDEDEEEPKGSSTTTISTPTSKRPKYERSTPSAATFVKNSLPASPASSSSSSKDKPVRSSFISNSIVPAVNQQSKQAKFQTAIQFGQLVASIGSIVVASQLCTIM